MFGLGITVLATAFTLAVAAITAKDPRCLLTRVFDQTRECPRIDAGEADPAGAFVPGGGGGAVPGSVPKGIPSPPAGLPGSVLANYLRSARVAAAVKVKFPVARYAGIYACRMQRGGGHGDNWSVHSIAGAVDFFGPVQAILRWVLANKERLGVWDAWIDNPPGDVHIQVIPNPPDGWVPPCAGGGKT